MRRGAHPCRLASLRSKAHGLFIRHRSRRIGTDCKRVLQFSEKEMPATPVLLRQIDMVDDRFSTSQPLCPCPPRRGGRHTEEAWKTNSLALQHARTCCLSMANPNARFTFSDAAFVTILRRPSGHRPSSDAARRTPPRADERVKAAWCSGDGRPGTGAASEGDWPGPRESDPRQRGLETLEVFVEGTRSRDRRFLAPKTGLIRALQVLHERSVSLSSSSLWWW